MSESAHRLDVKIVRAGEYVTLRDQSGTELTYRVEGRASLFCCRGRRVLSRTWSK